MNPKVSLVRKGEILASCELFDSKNPTALLFSQRLGNLSICRKEITDSELISYASDLQKRLQTCNERFIECIISNAVIYRNEFLNIQFMRNGSVFATFDGLVRIELKGTPANIANLKAYIKTITDE